MRCSFPAVEDPSAWAAIRMLYLGSALLFLATIVIGILNVFTPGELPRGQVLAHFHSGSIGWVTLSVVATAFWAVAGGRTVSSREAGLLQVLAGLGVIAAAGYIAAFASAYSSGRSWLLPLFGVPTGLVIITSFAYIASRLRLQRTVTTAHLLFVGALGIASLGAVMGILVGMARSGLNLLPAGIEIVAPHAGPMDMYLALAFAAIAEAFLGQTGRWTPWGMAQVVILSVSGVTAWLALLLDIGPLVPVALILFLIGFIVYFARIGWRALRVTPTKDRRPAVFFGGLAFPLYIGLFVYLVQRYFAQGADPPHVEAVIFVHVTFVAMATNWLFATHSAWRADDTRLAGLEPWAIWATNVGLVAFLAGVSQGRSEGALVMAIGILLAWMVLVWRHLPTRAATPA